MKHRKKLIEVALPLEAINAAAAREKSIRHGHPSTLASVVGAATVSGCAGGDLCQDEWTPCALHAPLLPVRARLWRDEREL